MIRKVMVLVLLTLYSTVAIGVPLHYHYCGGELQHVTIFVAKECESHDDTHTEAEEALDCCKGKEISHCNEGVSVPDCCEDQTEVLQLNENLSALVLLQCNYTDGIAAYEFTEMPSVQQEEKVICDAVHMLSSPPVQSYLEHCSLIFYG